MRRRRVTTATTTTRRRPWMRGARASVDRTDGGAGGAALCEGAPAEERIREIMHHRTAKGAALGTGGGARGEGASNEGAGHRNGEQNSTGARLTGLRGGGAARKDRVVDVRVRVEDRVDRTACHIRDGRGT